MNMKFKLTLAVACAAIPLLVFSEEQPNVLPDQAELFAAQDPSEAARYAELAPLSLTYMGRASEEKHAVRRMLIQMVRERLDDPEELRRYLDFIEKVNDHNREREEDWRNEIAANLRNDDRLYFFNYRVGNLPPQEDETYYSDFGILIIRDGEVVFREVHGTIGLKKNAPDPDRIEIDDL